MSRRNSRLPIQKGEAEMLSTKFPPARIRASTGSNVYSRLFQNCLSFQASSQMVSAMRLPQKSKRSWLLAGAKFRISSKTSYGQQHLRLQEGDSAIHEQRGRVHHGLARCGIRGSDQATYHGDAGGLRGDAIDGFTIARNERRAFHEIAWRIATNGKLRE